MIARPRRPPLFSRGSAPQPSASGVVVACAAAAEERRARAAQTPPSSLSRTRASTRQQVAETSQRRALPRGVVATLREASGACRHPSDAR
eukprot:2135953-Pyramimonas_sp.AAC.1